MSRILLLAGLLIFIFSQGFSNEGSALEQIEKYFAEAARGKSYYVSSKTIKSISTPEFLKITGKYTEAPDDYLRYKAIDLLRRKALLLEEPSERQPYIEILIQACKDDDSGISGIASKALTRFDRDDFTLVNHDSIFALLDRKSFHYERIILIGGFVGSTADIQTLQTRVENDSLLSKGTIWSFQLALARLGDPEALQYCMEQIEAAGLSDDVVYYLLSDLIYIRQPDAIDYVLKLVLSDQKSCSSSNPDNESSIICAFKIIELVAPVIDNFPLPKSTGGEVIFSDYDKDLKTVRKWITEGGEVQINLESF